MPHTVGDEAQKGGLQSQSYLARFHLHPYKGPRSANGWQCLTWYQWIAPPFPEEDEGGRGREAAEEDIKRTTPIPFYGSTTPLFVYFRTCLVIRECPPSIQEYIFGLS